MGKTLYITVEDILTLAFVGLLVGPVFALVWPVLTAAWPLTVAILLLLGLAGA